MEKTISLDSDCLIEGAVGRHLLLYYVGVSSGKQGCYTQDVDTLQLERVCYSCPKQSEVYCNFPPSLLSSPTVSSVPHHADHRGVDCRHQNHEKLTSPGNCRASAVVAAAARAPEPVEAGRDGRGEGG
ncbi:hypothetical protein VPH35_095058 [Triticum aestivum]